MSATALAPASAPVPDTAPGSRRRATSRASRDVRASSAGVILERADRFLAAAGSAGDAADQYREIYHAALRGAGALLAAREKSVRRGAAPRSAWLRLIKAAPEYADWIEYFTTVSARVAAFELSSGRSVKEADVAALHARVQSFLNHVEADIEA